MKKLYLHIGYHRTGTTHLQSFFHKNQSVFEQFGCLYPKAGLYGEAHAALALSLPSLRWQKIEAIRHTGNPVVYAAASEKFSADKLYQLLGEELSQTKCESAIVSSECFLEWLDISALKHQLKKLPAQLEVVVFLRRQDRWIESVYSQVVNDPELRFGGHFDQLPQHGSLDFESELNRWVEHFGTNRIHLRLYHENRANLDTIAELLHITGIDQNQLPIESMYVPATDTNASLDECCVEVLRQCNARGYTNSALQAVIQGLSGNFRNHGTFSKWHLPKPVAERLMERHRPANLRLFSRFGVQTTPEWHEFGPEKQQDEDMKYSKFSEILDALRDHLSNGSIADLKKQLLV